MQGLLQGLLLLTALMLAALATLVPCQRPQEPLQPMVSLSIPGLQQESICMAAHANAAANPV